MEQAEVANYVITNEHRSVAEAATKVLRVAGWLS
jgi:hypothetical protein